MRMSHDFIDDLLDALNRVLPPDIHRWKEVLIVCGMPEKTASLRYLSFNRQVWQKENRSFEFSAVAVINNRRASFWRLEGYRKKLSNLVFNPRWARNPLDIFINNLRCDSEMMDILSAARGNYTLMGLLKMQETRGTRLFKRVFRHTRPVVAIPGISDMDLKTVIAFEKANELRK